MKRGSDANTTYFLLHSFSSVREMLHKVICHTNLNSRGLYLGAHSHVPVALRLCMRARVRMKANVCACV